MVGVAGAGTTAELIVSRGIGAGNFLMVRSYHFLFLSEKKASISSNVLPSVSGTMIVMKIKLNFP